MKELLVYFRRCLSDNETIVECITGEDRCYFARDKLGKIQRGCATYDSNAADLEVRFNIIEKMSAGGIDTSPKALKSNFLCADPMCNNDANFQSVSLLVKKNHRSRITIPTGH